MEEASEGVGQVPVRFERKVDRSGGPDACHLWIGYVDPKGYGRFGGPMGLFAHRHALLWDGRPPGPNEQARHTCDNRQCVNPRHLLTGTAQDNKDDAVERRRHARHESAGRARLNWEQVRTIRAEHAAQGTSSYEFARRYGMSEYAMRCVITRKHWREDEVSA